MHNNLTTTNQVKIGAVIKDAWQHWRQNVGHLSLAIILCGFILIASYLGFSYISNISFALAILQLIIYSKFLPFLKLVSIWLLKNIFINLPLFFGLCMIAVKTANHDRSKFWNLFTCFKPIYFYRAFSLMLVQILVLFLPIFIVNFAIGYFNAVLHTNYMHIFHVLWIAFVIYFITVEHIAIPLSLDKNIGFLRSLLIARKTVNQQLFKLILISVISITIVAIPGIGLLQTTHNLLLQATLVNKMLAVEIVNVIILILAIAYYFNLIGTLYTKVFKDEPKAIR